LKRNHMKTLGTKALLVLAFFVIGSAGAWAEEFKADLSGLSEPQRIEAILSRVAKVQREAQTIHAEFTMEKKMSLLASPVKAEGILCVTKPDKVYWEVKEPIANTLIINGGTLWIHYPTLRQVDKVDVSGKQRLLMRYLGMDENGAVIKENYRIQLLGNSDEKGIYLLEFLPKNSRLTKRIARAKIWVNSQTWFPSRFDLWEPNGDYSCIKLKNAKLNKPIQDSIYEFRPPKGTVVNEPLKTSAPRSEK
jgi:outer membrane lipoprotein carrier protein